MTSFLKTRLGLMMFIQYVIWGAWYVTITTYLTSTLHFSATAAGAVFGTASVASLVSPFFVGLVADRFFATERVMAALYIVGALLMFLIPQVASFGAVYALVLGFCLCYFPTIALTNSITMQQVADPGRDFPLIRVMGTLGWIAINNLVGVSADRGRTHAVPARVGRLRRHGHLQPPGAAAHPAARPRADRVDAPDPRARRAGDAQGPVVSGVRARLVPGLHPVDVLLLLHQPVPQ